MIHTKYTMKKSCHEAPADFFGDQGQNRSRKSNWSTLAVLAVLGFVIVGVLAFLSNASARRRCCEPCKNEGRKERTKGNVYLSSSGGNAFRMFMMALCMAWLVLFVVAAKCWKVTSDKEWIMDYQCLFGVVPVILIIFIVTTFLCQQLRCGELPCETGARTRISGDQMICLGVGGLAATTLHYFVNTPEPPVIITLTKTLDDGQISTINAKEGFTYNSDSTITGNVTVEEAETFLTDLNGLNLTGSSNEDGIVTIGDFSIVKDSNDMGSSLISSFQEFDNLPKMYGVVFISTLVIFALVSIWFLTGTACCFVCDCCKGCKNMQQKC